MDVDMVHSASLPTAYVVRREGYVLTRVCPSVCLSHLGYPPSDLAEGGTPAGGGEGWVGIPPSVTDGVLDTPRSVCLLRSRRRIFLLSTVVEYSA